MWKIRQYGTVVDDFRAECSDALWDEVTIAASFLLEMGNRCPRPHSGSLGEGLFELRAACDGVHARLLYAFSKRERGLIVVTHAFKKKTRTVPEADKMLARKRMVAVEQGAVLNDFSSDQAH